MSESESALLPLPIVEVAGTPEAMGQQMGTILAPSISAFVKGRFAALRGNLAAARTGDVKDFRRAAEASYAHFTAWDPFAAAELEACAAAAEIPALDLFAASNLTDLRDIVLWGQAPYGGKPWSGPAADAEGCSAFAQGPGKAKAGALLLGQTWDLNPPDLSYVVALRRKPSDGLQSWVITCSGCPAIVGLNEAGVFVGTTNIKTTGGRPGVGYVNLIYRALRSHTAAEALECIRSAPRPAAHTYLVADATGATEAECDGDTFVTRLLPADGALWRTNHILNPEMAARQAEAPSASTLARFARLERAAAEPQTSETLIGLFSDRSDGVDSINRYPEDDQGTATNAVIVYDRSQPDTPCLQVCRGPADRGAWHTLRF